MPRSRVPQSPAFIHLASRLSGLAFSIACFYYLLYLATHWGDRHTYFAIFAVSTAIVVDLIEVCGLLDVSFTLKRLDVGWLISGNVVSMVLGVIGCLQLAFSDWGLSNAPSDYPRPWMDTLDLAFILMIPFSHRAFDFFDTRVCDLLQDASEVEGEAWKRGKRDCIGVDVSCCCGC
ncbi:uncharacterized protein P174DRAFT_452694 [Aspergillus novofumigatus IBT 16806]|uniref:Uncharacterized protein n=1 Tax=Aspergillus novofumigatus (strain IBT 16806) TaxID=1392255 RepID=A0A2I1C170_ASPN1|nr:uncharacterized protein P174DRAFT_452694 [Aspergillus novofumigatus IBT 16806]PKX91333.1 hypothetical protein P174DRAFT_452694 [Aspergillus novofumigatus IBT 16806]